MNCVSCNHQNSDSATFCANCGVRFSNRYRKVSFGLGAGILLLPGIFSWFTLRNGYSTTARLVTFGWLTLGLFGLFATRNIEKSSVSSAARAVQHETVAQTEEKAEAIKVSPAELMQDYEANEVAADEKYKGKIVQVTGHVDDIKKDITDSLYVTFHIDHFRGVQIFFDDSAKSQLASLRRGQKITIVGRVDGLMMNVLIKDAEII